MNDIMDCLVFTLEIHEDFEDLKLPTLDTLLYMEDENIIHFEFFQKPMSTNLVLQADTALSDSVKMASLKEEVVRRLKWARVYTVGGIIAPLVMEERRVKDKTAD